MYKKEFVSGLGSWLRSCGRSKWFLAFAVLLVFISSLVVSSRGIDWAKVHPDEGLIAQWMNEIDDAPYIQSRVYPEGLFTFARVFRQVKKDATKISSHAENWTQQPALKYAIWKPDSGGMNEWIGIGIIRRWNVAFVALSAVCVLLTACAILDSIPLSILAALFYAFHPFVVEHAHYAETDPLMLFSATLTFWLLTAAMKKKNVWLFAIGAFVAGLAIASKFSLAPFVFVVPVCAFVFGSHQGWKMGGTCLFSLGMLLVLGLGFLSGTPKLHLDPELFFEQARTVKHATYDEMRGLLGESASRPHAALVLKLRCIFDEAGKCRWLWWVLCMGSVPLWFKRRYRLIFTAFPLFGLSYLFLAAFFFPWFRNQEFLPVLPFLSVSAALPLRAASSFENRSRRFVSVAVSACAILAALWLTFVDAMRISSAFSSIETRVAASFRTGESAPYGAKYVFENYVCAGLPFPIARNGLSDVMVVGKIEDVVALSPELLSCDYFMRTVHMKGRGNVDPFTGKLYLSRQRALDAFLSDSFLLESWSILPGLRPTFSQPGVEFYAYRPGCRPSIDVPVPRPAPIVIKSGRYGYTGFRASSRNGLLGPVEAVGIVGKRTHVEFDPLPDGRKYYAVAVNLTGGIDADVAWSRGFTPLRQKVPSGQAILFTSDDGLSGPWDAVPSARVRMYGDDQRTLCIAVITPNRNVAARVLRKFGNDSAACGIEEKLEIPEDVRETLGARLPSPDIAICGIPSEVVNDFSAFRTGKKTFFGNVDSFDPRQSRKPGFHYIELPYVLDEITYRLTMTFFPNRMIWAIVNGKADVEFPECDLQGATLISKKIVKTNPDGGIDVEFVVAGHRRFAPFFFGIEAVGEIDGFFRLSQAVLRWDLGPTDNNSLETVNCGNGPE